MTIKSLLFILVMIAIASCTKKTDTNSVVQDSAQKTKLAEANLSGTFEYSDPIDGAYQYYKIEMGQEGDSLKGQLWAGIYLAKSEAGYTNPNVLTECKLRGVIHQESIDMQLTVTKVDRMEKDAPDILGMMNFPDFQTEVYVTSWTFSYEDGALVSTNGILMPDGQTPVKFAWEKIK